MKTFAEIKTDFENLNSNARWHFLFNLFGYTRVENKGWKRVFNCKYSWFNQEGKLIYQKDGDTVPYQETRGTDWFHDQVCKLLRNKESTFSDFVFDSFEKYVRSDIKDEKEVERNLNHPFSFFLLSFVSQVFVLYVANFCYEESLKSKTT